jgi:hypothetical protein
MVAQAHSNPAIKDRPYRPLDGFFGLSTIACAKKLWPHVNDGKSLPEKRTFGAKTNVLYFVL